MGVLGQTRTWMSVDSHPEHPLEVDDSVASGEKGGDTQVVDASIKVVAILPARRPCRTGTENIGRTDRPVRPKYVGCWWAGAVEDPGRDAPQCTGEGRSLCRPEATYVTPRSRHRMVWGQRGHIPVARGKCADEFKEMCELVHDNDGRIL